MRPLYLAMSTNIALLDAPAVTATKPRVARHRPEPLLRAALGESLRCFRAEKRVTLRELAQQANVSPGYISELERGRKEVSSELLASICHALGTTVADVLIETASSMAMHDMNEALAEVTDSNNPIALAKLG